MLRIQIGPVQDFIAAARTTRDLWSGSYLLSRLMVAGAECLMRKEGCEIIFPLVDKLSIYRFWTTRKWCERAETPCLSNKLVAYVPTEQAEDIALEVKAAIECTWQEIAQNVWNLLPAGIKTAERRQRYRIQVDNHLAVDYAHLPMDMTREQMAPWVSELEEEKDEEGRLKNPLLTALRAWEAHPEQEGARYAAVYFLVDHLMNGVRKVRAFQAWNPGAGRDAGWHAARDLAKDSLTGKEEQIFRLEKDRKEENKAFAGWDWRYMKRFDKYRGDVVGAITLIKRLWYLDAMAVHENELAPLDAKCGPNDSDEDKENHYYAVLAMDGDRIGQALTKAPKSDADEAYHKRFSDALADYAQHHARNIVKQNNGVLIYAGGDDVLALLPLDRALSCARDLGKAFTAHMNENVSTDLNMTVSAGIALAHSKTALQDAVEAARNAESRAKNTLGRDAFSVTLMKRSGEITEWGAHWKSRAIELVEHWLSCLEGGEGEGKISAKGAHRYAELLTPYVQRRSGLVRYITDTDSDPKAGEIAEYEQKAGKIAKYEQKAGKIAEYELESMLDRQWMGNKKGERLDTLRKLVAEYIGAIEDDKKKNPDTVGIAESLIGLCSVVAFCGRNPNQTDD